MKLKNGFYTREVGGKQVMVGVAGTGFSGVVRSNETAAFIVNQLKKETSEDEIVSAMLAVYDAPEEKIRADVKKIVGTLREIGAIEE
ncbi:MAG: PqqD family protein [Lachnospiraceae bacterium]|nr:PqqD family protein [Lachnospiraceae bacterium]